VKKGAVADQALREMGVDLDVPLFTTASQARQRSTEFPRFLEARARRFMRTAFAGTRCEKTGRNLSRIVTPPTPDCNIFLFKSDSSCGFAGGGLTFRRLLGKKGLCWHDIQGERTKNQ
jgi:hypothetical protein